MYLVTASEMRQMDQETIESFGLPGRILMENAGRGATRFFLEQFEDLAGKNVGVVAGRGNNGGDGFVIARYLFQKGIRVTVFLLSQSAKVRGDAAANLELLLPLDVPVIELPDQDAFAAHKISLRHQDIWIDAIFGTGLKSDVKGFFKTIIDFINHSNKPVFAVDIPSGLNSDTGQPCGTCIRADATATFAFAKTGHILFPGASYTGNLEIVDIGIPAHIAKNANPLQHLITPSLIRSLLQPRAPDAHKGNTGHLLVIAGSPGKTGAAAMTAISAMRTGAGLVTLGIPASLNAILETQVIEAMTYPLPEAGDGMLGEASFNTIMDLLSDKKCLALGPGLGTSIETQTLVLRIIKESPKPIVIDADGLNCLIGHTQILKDCNAPIILTPHPGEMARLIDTTAHEIQKDRIYFAREFAKKFNIHVALKGARTVIAQPDGNVFINPTGNSGMASGGMGDVLTGVIAGFIAQGYPLEIATHIGVYLHGAAADDLTRRIGPYGFLATEVMDAIPVQISMLVNQ
ncbi:MAG: NAD(P)H-hydrate dehydratase [Desulfobacterales bacterium]|nr:MAG: NAD(P)H-hydrate dehydratase [Desulfobacterales bacterium]UCD90056.1 MAG: NAD(P)H-hydrate dehydratase [Desulfobacterales bacterium]